MALSVVALGTGGRATSAMTAGNLIDELTRYVASAKQDPRENRLTAGLVAVMRRSQPLARAVIKNALDVDVPGNAKTDVRMQVPTRGGIIDVQADVYVPGRRTRRIWIEVKLHSALSGSDQLARYQRALQQTWEGEASLVMLVPAYRRLKFASSLPPAASGYAEQWHVATWQQVYRALARSLDTLDARRPAHWLGEQYLEYLEQENLMAPRKLTRAHLKILDEIEDAAGALDAVLEAAYGSVDRLEAGRRYEHSGYVEYPCRPGPGWAAGTKFVWGVGGNSAFASVHGRDSPGPVRKVRTTHAWLELTREANWELEPGQRGWAYWSVYAPLSKVAPGATTDDQGERLAAWVNDRFKDFDKSLPAAERRALK